MAKIGRPTLYSEELTKKICDRIASSSDGLHKICKELKIAPSSVFDWLTKYPEFTDIYTRAREAQADFMADEIIEISDEAARKSQRGVNEMKVGAFVNAKRLQVDARKWIASKLKPRKYGDKIDLTTDGEKIQGQIAWIGNHGNNDSTEP